MAQNIVTGRRSFLLKASLALAGTMIPADLNARSSLIMRHPFKAPNNLRILALTDLHFGQLGRRVDDWTVADMQNMVDFFQPDLLVVTGDAWFENQRGRGLKLCNYFCEVMASFNLPWAFVCGNHDKADDFYECEKIIASTPGSLYHGINSRGHYRLQLISGQAGNWNLLFINDAQPKLGFRVSQANWLKKEFSKIQAAATTPDPAILFCHIPIGAYRLMIKLGSAKGICWENISCEKCHALAMDVISSQGLIKAMFCGHDHLNDFKGIWQGVHLEYLRSTGWAGYGGEILPKGGTLIDLASDGTFISRTVFANGLEWQPPQRVGKFFSFLP